MVSDMPCACNSDGVVKNKDKIIKYIHMDAASEYKRRRDPREGANPKVGQSPKDGRVLRKY